MRESPYFRPFSMRSYSMPKRQDGYRTGKPPYDAIALTSFASSISKWMSKKSRPASRATPSMRRASSCRPGVSVFPEVIACTASAPPSEERADRLGDPFAVVDARRHEPFLTFERRVEILLELSRAVGALDLAVAELIHAREDLVAQEVDAALRVPRGPVVPVRVVERVDVPILGPVLLLDQRQEDLVGRADLRAARLAQVEERLLIDDFRHRVVDDVDDLEILVLAPQPRIDPEGLDADDVFLLATHRAGYVHDVEDHRRGIGLRRAPARTVALVVADRDDLRSRRIPLARGDRALERVLVRAAEMAQRLRPGLAHAVVAPAVGEELTVAARLDVGELELFAEHPRELLELDFDLEDVRAGLFAGGAAALAFLGLAGDGLALLALALSDALLVLAEVEARELDLRDGDRDVPFAAAPEELGRREVLAQIGAQTPADDFAEARAVGFDAEHRLSS